MTPEQARQKLIDSLTEVRKRFDAGADDWQHSLLMTFREYARAIGIDPKLLHLLERMRLEIDDAILKARGQKQSKTPARKAIPLSVAAAAVTVLKENGTSVAHAERKVARATGIERSVLKGFRDNLHRGLVAADAAQAYQAYLVDMRGWPTADLLKQIDGLHRFVKSPV